MSRSIRILSVVLGFARLCGAPSATIAQEVPESQLTLNYDGELFNAQDTPVTGSFSMSFSIYRVPEGGQAVWSETHDSVDVLDGRFFVTLGTLTPFDDALASAGQLYVGLVVGQGDELAPRLRLGGSLLALSAQRARLADQASDVLNKHIHPNRVSIGERLVIDENGQWVGDIAGLQGVPGEPGASGQDGVGIAGLQFNDDGELVATLTDGNQINAGGLVWTQSCPEGSAIRGFGPDGFVLCEVDDDTQTTYDGRDFVTSGQNCSGDEIAVGFSADGVLRCAPAPDPGVLYTGADFATSNQRCEIGEVAFGLDESGRLICVVDQNTVYNGTHFATSGQSCPENHFMAGISPEGELVCLPTVDENTTYTGNDFAISDQNCEPGFVAQGISPAGQLRCVADQNSQNVYSGVDFATSDQGCPHQQVVAGIAPDGLLICVDDADTVQLYDGQDFAFSAQDCLDDDVVIGISPDGEIICAPNVRDLYFAGLGLTLADDTFAVDPTVFQRRITNGCPAGEFMTEINEQGQVICAPDTNTQNTYTGADFALSNQLCPDGHVVLGFEADGQIRCGDDQDSQNTYSGVDFATSDQLRRWSIG